MSINQQLLNALLLILPFELSDIQEVEENCGTVWITLKSGKSLWYLVSVLSGCIESLAVTFRMTLSILQPEKKGNDRMMKLGRKNLRMSRG
jgi:hypothetical protein